MAADRESSLRMLAPASLLAFTVVFMVVVVSSLTGGSPSQQAGGTGGTAGQERPVGQASRPGPESKRRAYIVKSGDTLSKIASRTGVPIERLQVLNPLADPQQLVTGQRIKLRR